MAPGPPLLTRAEVVHEAELDVRHGLAVGDRNRKRVVGYTAFGVQRAVDRVEDHADPLIAVVDGAPLLRQGDEAVAVFAHRFELAQHDALGRSVDLEGAVTAGTAGAGFAGALLRTRRLRQHALEPADRAAAHSQPVDVER